MVSIAAIQAVDPGLISGRYIRYIYFSFANSWLQIFDHTHEEFGIHLDFSGQKCHETITSDLYNSTFLPEKAEDHWEQNSDQKSSWSQLNIGFLGNDSVCSEQ